MRDVVKRKKRKYSIFSDKCFQNAKYSTNTLTYDENMRFNIRREVN